MEHAVPAGAVVRLEAGEIDIGAEAGGEFDPFVVALGTWCGPGWCKPQCWNWSICATQARRETMASR